MQKNWGVLNKDATGAQKLEISGFVKIKNIVQIAVKNRLESPFNQCGPLNRVSLNSNTILRVDSPVREKKTKESTKKLIRFGVTNDWIWTNGKEGLINRLKGGSPCKRLKISYILKMFVKAIK